MGCVVDFVHAHSIERIHCVRANQRFFAMRIRRYACAYM